MRISILCENRVGVARPRGLRAEWGLSVHLATRHGEILFDAGHTDVFRHNAQAMKIDLSGLRAVALSHRHWDHAGGFRHLAATKPIPFFLHPQAFSQADGEHKAGWETRFDLRLSAEPREMMPNVFFLGEVPRRTAFEKGRYKSDPMPDDTGIAIRTGEGAVVISGCAHGGICNLCEHARDVLNQPLRAVLGGFHLTVKDRETVALTLDYLREQAPELVVPMHCVDADTQARFHAAFDAPWLATGTRLDIPN